MISFGNAASSPSGLIPLKTAFKNFTLFKKPLYKCLYKLPHSKINQIYPASFENIENREGF